MVQMKVPALPCIGRLPFLAFVLSNSMQVHGYLLGQKIGYSIILSKSKNMMQDRAVLTSSPAKAKPNVYRSLSFGDRYKVELKSYDETWLVQRPRLWQEKVAGILHCFRRHNSTESWKPNTFVQKTKLLTSTGHSMGRGLFAMRDFDEGEIIGHYVGKIVGSADRKDDIELKAYVQGKVRNAFPSQGWIGLWKTVDIFPMQNMTWSAISRENTWTANRASQVAVCLQGPTPDCSVWSCPDAFGLTRVQPSRTGLMQFANDARGTVLQVRLPTQRPARSSALL